MWSNVELASRLYRRDECGPSGCSGVPRSEGQPEKSRRPQRRSKGPLADTQRSYLAVPRCDGVVKIEKSLKMWPGRLWKLADRPGHRAPARALPPNRALYHTARLLSQVYKTHRRSYRCVKTSHAAKAKPLSPFYEVLTLLII